MTSFSSFLNLTTMDRLFSCIRVSVDGVLALDSDVSLHTHQCPPKWTRNKLFEKHMLKNEAQKSFLCLKKNKNTKEKTPD